MGLKYKNSTGEWVPVPIPSEINDAAAGKTTTYSSSKIEELVTSKQDENTFYGLAKASGDTTQATSDNPIGTYTDEAKASIQEMLGINDLINNAIGNVLGGSY